MCRISEKLHHLHFVRDAVRDMRFLKMNYPRPGDASVSAPDRSGSCSDTRCAIVILRALLSYYGLSLGRDICICLLLGCISFVFFLLNGPKVAIYHHVKNIATRKLKEDQLLAIHFDTWICLKVLHCVFWTSLRANHEIAIDQLQTFAI